jgi:CRISPR-associated endonuclease/helicase Cas3
MSLRREDFTCYFAELHDGHAPFAWQERLLDEVLEQGRWPAAITAPTGAGKTAVIDVHVFAQALAATGSGPTPPRRLSMVVNRRVLVDDQYVYAQTLARRLAAATGDGRPVLAAMRERLWRLAVPDPDRRAEESAGGERSPLVVARLRGGAPPSRSWRDLPTAAAVICATPEMWGSRLLFRGYGSARGAWPREAGLLACDSVLIVDEAHLARQLLCTARRVAELGAVAEQAIGASPVQVVETTATPAGAIGADSVGVEAGDLDHELLSARLSRPKPVSLRPVKDWEATKATAKAVSALAEASIEMLTGAPAAAPGEGACATVGCFVNTVARALAVASELRNRTVDGRALRVVALCGQVRPIDVDRLERHHPGLLTVAGNGEVDVLVSTQSLEVGVDLDLAGMVTELASGSALAQRAGRVNRRGLRSRAPIVVTIPEGGEVTERVRSGPYEAEELRAALDWLHLRESQPEGLAPWALRSDPPPQAGTRRMLCQRPELAQAWHWARTSDDLAAEPELELWLADEFATDTSVGLVVRDELPEDAPDAIRLLRVLPPRRHEVFSVPFGAARDALAALRA